MRWSGRCLLAQKPSLVIVLDRMGCNVPGVKDRGTMIKDQADNAHKLPRATGGNTSSEALCQRQIINIHPSQDFRPVIIWVFREIKI